MAQNDDTEDPVDKTELRVKAHQWCKASVGGVRCEVSPHDMVLEHISGGLSSYPYLCQLPTNISPLAGEPRQVLLRMYSHVTKSNMDVLLQNSVIFALLAEKRLGPKPYGMFCDGRIEEFIEGETLKHTDLSRPDIMQLVAGRMAIFHSLDMPLCKQPQWMVTAIKRWIAEVQSNFKDHFSRSKGDDSEAILRLQSIDMEKECDILMATLGKVNSPVVFCHNDAQEGNILYDAFETDPEKKMTIIDWEFGNYNYRGFDMGNHFCQWAIGFHGNTFSIEPEKYPSRSEQYAFFRHYLKAQGQKKIGEEDLRQVYTETNTFALASHFLWGVWAAVQGHSSSTDFRFWDYAASRFEQYFQLKEQLPVLLKKDDG